MRIIRVDGIYANQIMRQLHASFATFQPRLLIDHDESAAKTFPRA